MIAPLRSAAEDELVALADGRLAPERAAEILAWLRLPENAAERARVERWRGQGEALRAALDPILTEPVPAALLTGAAVTVRPRRWLVPTAAAAALGIAIGIGGGFVLWGPQPAVAREIAQIGLSAHEVYVREVRHPVEVGVDDKTHLLNWLSNRIEMPLVPPDLTAMGLTLLGGRLIPEDGKPAAQLMYEDASGQRYTLLIARYDEPSTTSLRFAEGNTAAAYYWMAGTVGYVFAGPPDRERLLALTHDVYDQLI